MPEPEHICAEQVFERFYKDEITSLRNYLYYKYGDLIGAEDIAQNAFIKLWENCNKINPEKAKSFLYVTANNLSLNVIKHEKIKLRYKSLPSRSITKESPEYLMISDEFQDKIDSAIGGLSEKQREVFLMNRIDKLKYREIAEILDISIKAVEKRMHAALIQLRKKIGNI